MPVTRGAADTQGAAGTWASAGPWVEPSAGVVALWASMNPYRPVRVAQPCVGGEEVAAALGTSRYAGRELVDTARLLAAALLATAAALGSGDIDWGKANIIATMLGDVAIDVAIEVALDVQDRVLPGAGARTHAQLRTDLAKALIVVDPTDAEQRTVRAVDKRPPCPARRQRRPCWPLAPPIRPTPPLLPADLT